MVRSGVCATGWAPFRPSPARRYDFPVGIGIISRPAGSSAVTQQAPPGPARPPRMAPAAAGCGAGAAALARSSAWDCRCAEIKSPSSLRLPKLEGAGRVVASDSDLKRHVARRGRRPPAQAGGRQPVTRHCVEIEFESGHGDYHDDRQPEAGPGPALRLRVRDLQGQIRLSRRAPSCGAAHYVAGPPPGRHGRRPPTRRTPSRPWPWEGSVRGS